jgi:iron complex outermembrane receptor protein
VKLMYGSAFRAANAYERFYGADPSAGGFRANPDIRPESIDSYELLIVQTLSSHLHLLGSAYSFSMHDLIALYTDPASNLLSFQNLAEVKGHGAGLEVEGAWPFVRFRASYVVQRATWAEAGASSTALANSPHHMVKGRLVVPLLHERLQLFAEGRFLSQRDSVQSLAGAAAPVPAYLQVNLGGTLKIVPALSLQLVARNVTNDKHRDPASDEFVQPDLAQEGLSVWLRLRYDWSLPRPR